MKQKNQNESTNDIKKEIEDVPMYSTKSSRPHVDLDNIDLYSTNSNLKIKLNSPRSLEALKRVGLNQEDLHYVSIKDFKLKNPQLKSLPLDLQQSRDDYLESLRITRIDEVRKIRAELVENSNETSKTSTNFKPNISLKNSQLKSTALSIELKSFERLKKKQEAELFNMIQFELKTELRRQENEISIKKKKENEEEQTLFLLKARKIEQEEKRQREKENFEKIKFEDEQRRQRDSQLYMEEQRKLKEQLMIENEKLREARLRQVEEKRKQDEFRNQLDAMFEENRRQLDKKISEMEKNEIHRQEIIEKKKLEAFITNTERANKNREKIENIMKNLEQKLNSQREEYEEKEKKNEERKRNFELMRQLDFERKKQESLQREEEMKEVLRRNEDIAREKVISYQEKQKLIEIKKLELGYVTQLKQNEKEEKTKQREDMLRQTLNWNEKLMSEKKLNIIRKIERNDSKVKELNKIKERKLMEKTEHSLRKRIEKEEKFKQLSRIDANEREKVIERINEKSQRQAEFRIQRSFIAEQKREIFDEVSRKKKDYTQKFEQLFKKKKIDEKSIRELEQMFPDNSEIAAMISSLKQSDENRKNNLDNSTKSAWFTCSNIPVIKSDRKDDRNNFIRKSDKRTSASSFNKSSTCNNLNVVKNEYKEKDFEKRRNELRLNLNQNFLKVLSDERKKEDEREKILANTIDPIEHKNLDEVFGYERAVASKRIMKLNEYIFV